MTEAEYIAATNLAKVRIAISVVSEILPGFDGVTTDEGQQIILGELYKWQDDLTAIVKSDEE